MDISWKQMLLGLCAMGMIAAVIRPSAFDDNQPVTPALTPAVIVEKHVNANQPDGYISQVDCARIDKGMRVADLVYKYGWPASDYAYDNFDEAFFYPVHNAGDDRCIIDVDDNKVVSAIYRDEE